jgi:hypothetical protein
VLVEGALHGAAALTGEGRRTLVRDVLTRQATTFLPDFSAVGRARRVPPPQMVVVSAFLESVHLSHSMLAPQGHSDPTQARVVLPRVLVRGLIDLDPRQP